VYLISQYNPFIGVAGFGVILELGVFVDGGSARSSSRRVTSLDHKIGRDAVEDCSGIVVVFAVLEEVLGCEGSLVREEGDVDGSDGGV
jgi:hypothetical protein